MKEEQASGDPNLKTIKMWNKITITIRYKIIYKNYFSPKTEYSLYLFSFQFNVCIHILEMLFFKIN